MAKEKNKSPHEKWEILKKEILDKTDIINKETSFIPVEPDWWIEMMVIRQCILDVEKNDN